MKQLHGVNGTVAKCEGCANITPLAGMCLKLSDLHGPAVMWKRGVCPYATHVKRASKVEDIGKKRVGQQKQKRGKV
jgi:hypothetical protein